MATTQASGPIRESIRVAEPADLKLYIYAWKVGPDGFPDVVLDLRNELNEDLLVANSQGSVTIHCGAYAQQGPALSGLRRREVLDPFGSMKFLSPKGGWVEIAADGNPELVIPLKLPPGKYPLWATFQVPGPRGGTIETAHQICEIN